MYVVICTLAGVKISFRPLPLQQCDRDRDGFKAQFRYTARHTVSRTCMLRTCKVILSDHQPSHHLHPVPWIPIVPCCGQARFGAKTHRANGTRFFAHTLPDFPVKSRGNLGVALDKSPADQPVCCSQSVPCTRGGMIWRCLCPAFPALATGFGNSLGPRRKTSHAGGVTCLWAWCGPTR